MAALHVLLSLTILLQLGEQQRPPNSAPCQPTNRNRNHNRDDPYTTFVKRHIRPDLPNTLDQNLWSNYLWSHEDCERPIQSFLNTSKLDLVKDVCSVRGGVVYRENQNLCISREKFTFVTVRIKKGTCNIRSVKQENKHLILACDRVNNQCVPVHFAENRYNETPGEYPKGCRYRPRHQPTKV